MKLIESLFLAFAWFAVSAPGLIAGEGSEYRSYALGDHGILELSIPVSWHEETRQTAESVPPTIVLNPAGGDGFKILITPLWSPGGEKHFNTAEKIRELLKAEMGGLASGAVEKELTLKPVDGKVAQGYYFMATDKAPKSGEYRYLIRGGVGVGDLLMSVTVLSHQKDSEGIKGAVELMRSARQRKP